MQRGAGVSTFADDAREDAPDFEMPPGTEANGHDAEPTLRFKFITDDELESLELPEQLIEGLLFVGSHVMIIGDPGSLKSFLALDWAYHIVRGRRWAGRNVKQGSVLYVLAEGKGQFKLRTLAWKQVNDA